METGLSCSREQSCSDMAIAVYISDKYQEPLEGILRFPWRLLKSVGNPCNAQMRRVSQRKNVRFIRDNPFKSAVTVAIRVPLLPDVAGRSRRKPSISPAAERKYYMVPIHINGRPCNTKMAWVHQNRSRLLFWLIERGLERVPSSMMSICPNIGHG